MAQVVSILTDYPRQNLAAHLTAILSFIQEKRKKRGLFSRKEEVIESIRLGYIPLQGVTADGLSVLVDRLCSLEPVHRLEDVGAWESALSTLRTAMDHRTFASRVSALSSFRPPSEEVRLRGIAPSFLFPLLNRTTEIDLCMQIDGKCDPLSSKEVRSLMSRLDELESSLQRLTQLVSEVRLSCDEIVRELDSWIERYPPDSNLRREYQHERSRTEGACSTLVSRIEGAAKSYEELINTLRSAPQLEEVLLPVYLVETRGKVRRRFLISNLRFKTPGLTHRIKDFLGKFDSLFEETHVNKRLSSILRVDRIEWGDNLLSEDIREIVYGELAILQEEGFVDEEYVESIAELISKSLLQ